ncbi:hypothetical protein D3C87_1917190 [compost metagenome]
MAFERAIPSRIRAIAYPRVTSVVSGASLRIRATMAFCSEAVMSSWLRPSTIPRASLTTAPTITKVRSGRRRKR